MEDICRRICVADAILNLLGLHDSYLFVLFVFLLCFFFSEKVAVVVHSQPSSLETLTKSSLSLTNVAVVSKQNVQEQQIFGLEKVI